MIFYNHLVIFFFIYYIVFMYFLEEYFVFSFCFKYSIHKKTYISYILIKMANALGKKTLYTK